MKTVFNFLFAFQVISCIGIAFWGYSYFQKIKPLEKFQIKWTSLCILHELIWLILICSKYLLLGDRHLIWFLLNLCSLLSDLKNYKHYKKIYISNKIQRTANGIIIYTLDENEYQIETIECNEKQGST